MKDNVRLFPKYWMGLYSNCCLYRDYAVELLNNGKPEEDKAGLMTTEQPNVPRIFFGFNCTI